MFLLFMSDKDKQDFNDTVWFFLEGCTFTTVLGGVLTGGAFVGLIVLLAHFF